MNVKEFKSTMKKGTNWCPDKYTVKCKWKIEESKAGGENSRSTKRKRLKLDYLLVGKVEMNAD